MAKKKILVHPNDIAGRLAEAKALGALYDFDVEVTDLVPLGRMLVINLDEQNWVMYDESRRGRDISSKQLGAEDI